MSADSDTKTVSISSNWVIPAKGLSIASVVFGFTCLTVLVVAVAVNGDSALSTVALALAILAFTVQLIVFIAQHALSTEQGRRSEELFGQMQRILAEITEKASGTEREVQKIGDRTERMLPFLVSKNLAGAAAGDLDYGRLISDIERTLESNGGGGEASDDDLDPGWPSRRQRANDAAVIQELLTYPDPASAGAALEILHGLDPPSRLRLQAYGEDEVRSRGPGSPLDPALLESSPTQLEQVGLIEEYPESETSNFGSRFMHLTDLGRSVARLLTAEGEPPAALPALKEIRDEIADAD